MAGLVGDVGPVGDVGGSAETGFEHAAVNDKAARMTIAAPRWTMIHSVTNPDGTVKVLQPRLNVPIEQVSCVHDSGVWVD
ncbi:MAG: hypothetical protein ACRDP9_26480 [Kribbellaceae bacterium]